MGPAPDSEYNLIAPSHGEMNCQARTRDQKQCTRSVAAGQQFCWQHALGWRAKWRSLTRNQTVVFVLALSGIALTAFFGIIPLFSHSKSPSVVQQIQSSGDRSPNVVDNSGSVNIDNGQSSAKRNDQSQRKPEKQR